MLHLHFGAGRLGLGLVGPFFQTTTSELRLLNRAISGQRDTGNTALDATRRNTLLLSDPDRVYVVQAPDAPAHDIAPVRYSGYHLYDSPADVDAQVHEIVGSSAAARDGVVVTASILNAASYTAVVSALNVLSVLKGDGARVGNVFLIACENTLSADEVFQHDDIAPLVSASSRRHVRRVPAMVDRMCVSVEEFAGGVAPAMHRTVAARAERFGVLKLGLAEDYERQLMELCGGSRVEFSHHLDVEKHIKAWLLNGSHWLIALSAFEASEGDVHLKLNEYLTDEHHGAFARDVLGEMRDGIERMLEQEPQYAQFSREVDVGAYLDAAEAAVLERFKTTDDSMARILARFRAPSCDDVTTIESFTKRFLDRIDGPIAAYRRAHGRPPAATSQSLVSLCHLLASGMFVDSEWQRRV